MKRNWKDELVTGLYIKMQRHKALRWYYRLCTWVVLLIYSVFSHFAGNVKRYGCLLASFLFLLVSSSFSFKPEEVELTDSKEELKEEWIAIQENYEYQPLDLSDYLDSHSSEHNENGEEETFSLEDFLSNTDFSLEDYESREDEDIKADDWKILLVNKQHPVPEGYSCELANISGGLKCDARILNDLVAMLSAAHADGVEIRVCSPYRSFDRQTVLFNKKLDYYMEKGYSYMEAYKISAITVNVPGASEHQLGLAFDIVSDTYSELDAGFGDTLAGKWLVENGYKFGFILRYPLGKEYVTGIEFEPWHYRYVGKTAATIIMEQGITLEEFVDNLK